MWLIICDIQIYFSFEWLLVMQLSVSSDGIRCISVGMIATISISALNSYKGSECSDAL